MRGLAVALLVVAGMAGCLQGGGDENVGFVFDPLWSERALPFGDGHDHAEPLHHLNLTTPNFEVLAHDALDSDFYGAPPGSTFCGDAKQMPDGRRIAAAESRSKVGFTLVDVTDPRDPQWIGELVMENTRVYDLAVVPDGRHVVLVTQSLENLPVELPPVLHWKGACGESTSVAPPLAPRVRPESHTSAGAAGFEAATDPVPRPAAILLVDIADPANPRIVDHQPLVGNGHSAFSTIIANRTWVLATTTGPATRLSAYETTSAFEFYELAQTPAGARLNLLSVYKPDQEVRDTEPPVELGPRGHDSWLAVHPGTGQTLAYLAAWERMEILDMADPAQPRLLGQWTDRLPGREGAAGEIHSVLPLEVLWQDRHYTIVGPEWRGHPEDQPTGSVWVLDTTDPATPQAVAAWTLPHEVEWSGDFMFSNHYYSTHHATLFVSMYHGGVWAVDLAPVLQRTGPAGVGFLNLRSVGVFLPVDPGVEVAYKTRWAPTVEEVLAFEDGTLLTFDGLTGAWTFRFDASQPAPAPDPWPVMPA